MIELLARKRAINGEVVPNLVRFVVISGWEKYPVEWSLPLILVQTICEDVVLTHLIPCRSTQVFLRFTHINTNSPIDALLAIKYLESAVCVRM